jgi:acetyl/propionyl-CoA carboxylase alpha subunit
MFNKILIANRGEILRRICRTLAKMNVFSVAVYSEVDRFAPAVLGADEAVARMHRLPKNRGAGGASGLRLLI